MLCLLFVAVADVGVVAVVCDGCIIIVAAAVVADVAVVAASAAAVAAALCWTERQMALKSGSTSSVYRVDS